ncbi:MAG: regulatory protein GemA [Pseudomonadota bacterium]
MTGLANTTRPAARRATFNRADQRRRAMLAKVHIGKKELGLHNDDYRQILQDETGHSSAGDCDVAQLERVLSRFKARGWKPLPKARGGARPASHPMAKKARALWISLYQLGVVRDPSEKALEAFAKRQLKCEKLAWAKQSHGGKLVEALKDMAQRNGWAQVDANGNRLPVRELKEGLCKAILAKMVEIGEVPADWTIDVAAWRLCGIDTAENGPMSGESYADLAEALGRKLRDAGGAA